MLFNSTIRNWEDWSEIYQSVSAFDGIIREILLKENLPVCEIENLTPGTNAVFKVGEAVIKIYAPKESGMDQTADRQTEIFAARFADALGLTTPSVLAEGTVHDRYSFAYIVMSYIAGRNLGCVLNTANRRVQYELGKQLRNITDRLNVPCEPFNKIDVIHTPERSERWKIYPEKFKKERSLFIDSCSYGDFVLVHGDLCADNILFDEKMVLIDFADAVLAPKCYEHSLIPFEYRDYPDFIRGYFGDIGEKQICDDVFRGILIHDFGGDIVKNVFGEPRRFTTLGTLYNRIKIHIGALMKKTD